MKAVALAVLLVLATGASADDNVTSAVTLMPAWTNCMQVDCTASIPPICRCALSEAVTVPGDSTLVISAEDCDRHDGTDQLRCPPNLDAKPLVYGRDDDYEYRCQRCGKRYRSTAESRSTACTVKHGQGDCCHYAEIEVTEKAVAPIPLGCDLATVLDALREAAKHIHGEMDGMVVLSVYRTQAQQLRDSADALDAKEASVASIRSVLAACDGK